VWYSVLHWLSVPQLIQIKITFLAFICIRGAISAYFQHVCVPTANLSGVTGQLADTPTRGLPTRGLDDSRTGQLEDATVDFACLVFVLLAACETASCPVRELAIRELAYPRVVQLPSLAEPVSVLRRTATNSGNEVSVLPLL